MKVYKNRPKRDCIILETSENNYEFILLVPVTIGHAEWQATQRVVTDDGHHFTNLNSAQRYYLDMHGEVELARSTAAYVKSRDLKKQREPVKMQFSTRQMIDKGVWFKFAAARKLPESEIANLTKKHEMTETEAKAMGLVK